MFYINKNLKNCKDLIEVKVNKVLKKENTKFNVLVKDSLENGKYKFYCDNNNNLNYYNESNYFNNCILINETSYKVRYLKEENKTINNHITILININNNNNLKYLYHLLSIKKENKKFYNGVGLQNFKKVLFLDSKIKIHKNIEEQNKISYFLENNLENIDNLIYNLIDKVNKL